MNLVCIYFFLIGCVTGSTKSYTVDELRCEVCKSIASEMEDLINTESSKALANVGCHRLDAKGNSMAKVIPLVQSESFLLEAMETACERMGNYARGYDKKTQKFRVVKMMSGDTMNPQMATIDAISDADLNESLKFHCEGITDEFENEFLKAFKSGRKDRTYELCSKSTGLCQSEEQHDSEL